MIEYFFPKNRSTFELEQGLLENSHFTTEEKEGGSSDDSSGDEKTFHLKRRRSGLITEESPHGPLHSKNTKNSFSERKRSGLITEDPSHIHSPIHSRNRKTPVLETSWSDKGFNKEEKEDFSHSDSPSTPISTRFILTCENPSPLPKSTRTNPVNSPTQESTSHSKTENQTQLFFTTNHASISKETSQKVYIFGNNGKSKSSTCTHKEKIIQLFEQYFDQLYKRNQPSDLLAGTSTTIDTAPEAAPTTAAATAMPKITGKGATDNPHSTKFNSIHFKPTIISTHCHYRELEWFYPCLLSNFAIYILVFNMKDLLYRPTHKKTIQDLKDYFELLHTHVFEDYYARMDEGRTVEVTPKILFLGTEDEEFSSTTSWMQNLSNLWESPNLEEKQKRNVIHSVFRSKQDIYHQVHEILRYYFHQESEYSDIVLYDQETQLNELLKNSGSSNIANDSKKFNFFPVPTTSFKPEEFLAKIFETPKNRFWNPFQPLFKKSAAPVPSEPLNAVEQENQPQKSVWHRYFLPKQAKKAQLEPTETKFSDDSQLILKNPANVLQFSIEEDRYRLIFNFIADFFFQNSIKVQDDSQNETLFGYYQSYLLQSTNCILSYDKWMEEMKQKTNLSGEKIEEGTAFLVAQKLLFHIHDHTDSVIWKQQKSSKNQLIVLRPFHYCFAMTEKVLLVKRVLAKESRNLPGPVINYWEAFLKNNNYRQQLLQQGLISRAELLTNGFVTEEDFFILQYLGIISPIVPMLPQSNDETDDIQNPLKVEKRNRSMRKLTVSEPLPTTKKRKDDFYYLFPYFRSIQSQQQNHKTNSFAVGSRFYFLLIRQTNTIITSQQKFEWKETKEHSMLPPYFFQRFIHQIVSSQLRFLSPLRRFQQLCWNSNNYRFYQNHCILTLYSFDLENNVQILSSPMTLKDGHGHLKNMPFSRTKAEDLSVIESHHAKVKIFVNPHDRIIQIEISKNWQNVFLIHRYLLQQMKIVISEFYSYLECLPVFELPFHPANTGSTGNIGFSFLTLSASNHAKRDGSILLIPQNKLMELIVLGDNRFRAQEFTDHGIPEEYRLLSASTQKLDQKKESAEIKQTTDRTSEERDGKTWNWKKTVRSLILFDYLSFPFVYLWRIPSYIYFSSHLCRHFLKEFHDYHKLQQETRQGLHEDLLFTISGESTLLMPVETVSSEAKVMNAQIHHSLFHEYIHPEDIHLINHLKSLYNCYFRFVKYYELACSSSLPKYSQLLEQFHTKLDNSGSTKVAAETAKVTKSLFTIFLPMDLSVNDPKAALYSNLITNLNDELSKYEKVKKEFYHQFSSVSDNFEYAYVSLPFFDPPPQPFNPWDSQEKSRSRSTESQAQATSSPVKTISDKELEYLLYSHTIYCLYSYSELENLLLDLGESGEVKENMIIYQWIFLIIFMKYFWTISHLKCFTMLIFDYPASSSSSSPVTTSRMKDISYFYQLFSSTQLSKSNSIELNLNYLARVERLMKKYCGELHRAYDTLPQRSGGAETVTPEQVINTCEKICSGSLYDLIYQVSEIIDLMNENPIKFEGASQCYTITKPCFVVITGNFIDNKSDVEAFVAARSGRILQSLALEYVIPPPPPPKFRAKEKKLTNKWIRKHYTKIITFLTTFALLTGSIAFIMVFQTMCEVVFVFFQWLVTLVLKISQWLFVCCESSLLFSTITREDL